MNDGRLSCGSLHLYLTSWEFCRNPNLRAMAPRWWGQYNAACITELIRVCLQFGHFFPWQIIYFIYFPQSSHIISILLILAKHIKKVINCPLWLCYGRQTAIIHYISIINFTSNVFQERLQKEKKNPNETLYSGNPCFSLTWRFSDLSAISAGWVK